MFKLGTGWLGWSPEVTLDTPMPQLFLAVEGKCDLLKRSNPFGGGEAKKPVKFTAEQEQRINEQRTQFAMLKADAAQQVKARNE